MNKVIKLKKQPKTSESDSIKQLNSKLNKLDKVNLGGDVKPVLKSLSRFPPVIVSTVKAITSKLAAFARSKQESFNPLSLWK